MKEKLYEEIERLKRELEQAQVAYLMAGGWSLTCKNPASLWTWQKGEFTQCSIEIALKLEEAMDSF